MTVDFSQTLQQAFTDALVRLREIDREEQAGESVCTCCGGRKKAHLHDGRCTSWVCSRSFNSNLGPERNKVERAIELMEELKGLV